MDSTIISSVFPVIYMTTSDINGKVSAKGDPNLTNANITFIGKYELVSVMESPAVVFIFDLAGVQMVELI